MTGITHRGRVLIVVAALPVLSGQVGAHGVETLHHFPAQSAAAARTQEGEQAMNTVGMNSGVANSTNRDQASAAAEAELKQMLQAQEEAWNRNDAEVWASFFSDTARFTTLRGDVFVGRPAIEDRISGSLRASIRTATTG